MANSLSSASFTSAKSHLVVAPSPKLSKKLSDSGSSASARIYTVRLTKRDKEGFGFFIRKRDEMPYFSIWEIIKNGEADANGRIRVGDIIMRVNNEDLSNASYERGLEIIKSFEPGAVVELTIQTNDFNSIMGSVGSSGIVGSSMTATTVTAASTPTTSSSNVSTSSNMMTYEKHGQQLANSIMSPLRKFKNKLVNCRSPRSSESINGSTVLVPPANSTIGQMIRSNGPNSPTTEINQNQVSSLGNREGESAASGGMGRLLRDRETNNVSHNHNHTNHNDEKANDPINDHSATGDLQDSSAEVTKVSQRLASSPLLLSPQSSPSFKVNNNRTNQNVSSQSNHHQQQKQHQQTMTASSSDASVERALAVSKQNAFNANQLHNSSNNTINHANGDEDNEQKWTTNGMSVSNNSNSATNNNNSSKSLSANNSIRIVQDGDEIIINIDDGIEIVTNRSTDRRVISLSPQCYRKTATPVTSTSSMQTPTLPMRPQQHQQHEHRKRQQQQQQHQIDDTAFLPPQPPFPTSQLVVPVRTSSITRSIVESSSDMSMESGRESTANELQHNQQQQQQKQQQQSKRNTNEDEHRKSPWSLSPSITGCPALAASINSRKESITSYSNQDVFSISNSNSDANVDANQRSVSLVSPSQSQLQQQPAVQLSQAADDRKIAKKKKGVKLKYLVDESSTYMDFLHHKSQNEVACTNNRCMGSLLNQSKASASRVRTKEEILEQAIDFINQFYASVKREGSKSHQDRLKEVEECIEKFGTYELKESELCFAARTAWRNASRCIGRIQWSKLQVFDARYVITPRGMFEAICNHIKYATNKGNIRSAITIFRQRSQPGHDFRVWNSQFVGYAGYKLDNKTIIGDRSQIEFTDICIKLGWKPKYTDYDVLPLVLQAYGQDPEWFELPADLVLEIKITHPKYDWFNDLNLKWYCVPGVSSMMLDAGGIEFTACPFNGWYMVTEIGRDFADVNRYDKLPLIAEKMGLEIKSNASLWKDKALIELNYAVLSSFQRANITIIDHHTASESFMKHYENEYHLRGGCPADWVWIVPPISGHLTPVFHLEMLNYALKPSYEYQDAAWKMHVWKQKTSSTSGEDKAKRPRRRVVFGDIARAVKFSAKLMGKALARRVKCTILYATETGKSERFAKSLSEIFKHAFDAKVMCMKDYGEVDLEHEALLLIVTSTFGNGDPPENGEEFRKMLHSMRKDKNNMQSSEKENASDQIFQYSGALANVRYSIFGLGNSSYPKFCSFAKYLDGSLHDLGAERISKLGLGDELCGQEESFRKWSVAVYKSAIETFCIDIDNSFLESVSSEDSSTWSPQTVRLTMLDEASPTPDLCDALSKLHNRKIYPTRLISRRNLQRANSGRVTLCVELNTQPHSSELEYKPGDHVGILAANRKELVDAILAKIANAPPPNQLIKVEILKDKMIGFGVQKQWVTDERYPPFTLADAMTFYLDITTPATQNLLMYFSGQCSSDEDRLKLEKLAKDHLAYEEWKINGYPNLAEILDEFNSLRPNASLLITQLPKLQPRFYSLSSSPKACDNMFITAGVVAYKPAQGRAMHYGVCTKWLDELHIGGLVPSFIREAPSFRLPDDKTCPIIMVAAGTGIAPFRSFWQERKIDKEMTQTPSGINGVGWGKMWLYFGCRQLNVDDLYKSEIEEMLAENVISTLYIAQSREPNKTKVYVQDLIEKNALEVYDAVYNKSGHFYICGDVRMAADVTTTLENVLVKQRNMTKLQAKSYVNEMKENLRFHEDIFGNNLTTKTDKN